MFSIIGKYGILDTGVALDLSSASIVVWESQDGTFAVLARTVGHGDGVTLVSGLSDRESAMEKLREIVKILDRNENRAVRTQVTFDEDAAKALKEAFFVLPEIRVNTLDEVRDLVRDTIERMATRLGEFVSTRRSVRWPASGASFRKELERTYQDDFRWCVGDKVFCNHAGENYIGVIAETVDSITVRARGGQMLKYDHRYWKGVIVPIPPRGIKDIIFRLKANAPSTSVRN